MPVITVSRQLGARGSEVAASVATRLGLRFVDREIIHRAARQAGVPELALQELEYEGRRGLVDRVLDIVKAMPPIPSTPQASLREAASPMTLPFGLGHSPTRSPFAEAMEAYVRTMEALIRDLAAAGDVCILDRAGQVILRDRPDTLHVQIVAPLEKRVETVMHREGLSRAEAMDRVLNSDRMHHEHLRRYYEADWLDPCLYDLVINTGRVSVDAAVDLIVSAVADIK